MSAAGGRRRAGRRGHGRGKGSSPRGTERGSTPVRQDSSKRKGLGGDQVEGRHAVRELLLAGNRRVREVLLASDLDSAVILDEIIDLADEAKVPIREIGRGKFESEARTEAPQGVLARAAPLTSVDLDVLAGAAEGPAFLLVVDGVTDPGNLGALLRTAECAGVTGVVLPRHRAAHITPTVAKAAAGAIEHLRFAMVAGLPAAVNRLSELGVWTVGLDMVADQELFDVGVTTEPVAVVLGAEGRGLSRLVGQRCDVVARIPMVGALGSLNVAAAGAVACFEVARRRR